MPDEDLKSDRETGQEGEMKKSGDMSMLMVLGVSAAGGLVAFCALTLVLGIVIKKRKNRSAEIPVENEAPIVRRDRTARRTPSHRLSLLCNRVQSSEARLASLEVLVNENFEDFSTRVGQREQFLLSKSSESTRVSSRSSVTSFESRRQAQRDHLDQVSRSKRGNTALASVAPNNLRRTQGHEDLNVSSMEMMPLIAPRKASEYLGASVQDYQTDGFQVSLDTLGESVDIGSSGCSA